MGVIIALLILVAGGFNTYLTSQRLNENTCLGCLALIPRVAPFTEFWYYYPNSYGSRAGEVVQHPPWVVEEVNNGSTVMLFFWYHGCKPCKQQWDDMKEIGLVDGTEEKGRMNSTYAPNVTLINIDVINSERKSSRKVYAPPGQEDFTPITVIVTGNASGFAWYSFQGPADGVGGRPSVRYLVDIINLAVGVMET